MMSLGGLFLASLPYAAISGLRALLFDWRILKVNKLPVPVISIGNITAGGTGKTPMTLLIGSYLKEAGIPYGVLSRGYGRKSHLPFSVGSSDGFTAEQLGDEPKLLGDRLGCALGIGPNRYFSGQSLLRKYPLKAFLLDDGFAHRKLFRNLDILLVDATVPFGDGFLPKGRLREPLRGLRRAEAIVISGDVTAERQEHIEQVARGKGFKGPFFTAKRVPDSFVFSDGSPKPLESLKEAPLFLFSGIEGPAKFENSIKKTGMTVAGHISYPDHYPFDEEELTQIRSKAGTNTLVTTEKDLARLGNLGTGILALRIRMEVQPEKPFRELILSKVKQQTAPSITI